MKAAILFAAAWLATLALALPKVLATPTLLPDAIEYLGIAWSWASGAGFVDPVLYSYFLPDTAPPVPALVMRAPVVPALLAAPFALGASLHDVLVLHAIAAAACGAAGVFVARRLGGLPAAAAFAIGFCLSYPWIFATQMPLTEAASVGALLALAALLPRALASVPAAIGFGALVAFAWLVRPNLALAAPALVGTALLVQGPRVALRSVPMWSALAVFVALQQGISLWLREATGFPPYEHYKVLLETTAAGGAAFFEKQWIGWRAWVAQNPDTVLGLLRANAAMTARLLFVLPDFHFVGWLVPPALVHVWLRRDDARPLRIGLALLGLGLLAVHLASWGAIDPRRLLIPAALCFWLLAASWLAHLARASGDVRVAAFAPALAVVFAWLLSPSAAGTARLARQAWASPRAGGVHGVLERSFAPAFCAHMDRDAIVVSPEPWEVYLACGNAGWWIARDLDDDAVLARYLDATTPGYLIAPLAGSRRFDASPRLERVAAHEGFVLYALRDAPAKSRPWRAPPPLVPGP